MKNNIVVIVFVTAFALLSSYTAEGRDDQKDKNIQLNSTLSVTSSTANNPSIKNKSIADKYFNPTVGIPKEPMLSSDPSGQFCETDNTGIITIYTTNGSAQNEIDVELDGRSIGSLKTYFPDGEPNCKTPSSKGIITISVPAGKHILNATSNNVRWSNHSFSVQKCRCMVLPLS